MCFASASVVAGPASHSSGGEHGAAPGAEVLGRDLLAGDLAQVVVDVAASRSHARVPVVVDVAEELAGPAAPGSGARRARAAGRATATACSLAALAAEREAKLAADRRRRGRSRSVVRPNEPFSRAYSSLPTRMSVVSSSRTTVASTFSRGRPRRAEIVVDAARGSSGRAPAERDHASYFVSSRCARQRGVVAVLLAPARVAAGRLDVAARRSGRSRRPSRPAESRSPRSGRAPRRRGSSRRRRPGRRSRARTGGA